MERKENSDECKNTYFVTVQLYFLKFIKNFI